jgi:hypothetical protein
MSTADAALSDAALDRMDELAAEAQRDAARAHLGTGDRVADSYAVGCLEVIVETFAAEHDWRADESPLATRECLDRARVLLLRLQALFPDPFPMVTARDLVRAARLMGHEIPYSDFGG